MTPIPIDVNDTGVWILIKEKKDYTIRFINEQEVKVTVTFPDGAPPDIPDEFEVEKDYVEYRLSKDAPNGEYPWLASSGGGTTGNGGIEIRR